MGARQEHGDHAPRPPSHCLRIVEASRTGEQVPVEEIGVAYSGDFDPAGLPAAGSAAVAAGLSVCAVDHSIGKAHLPASTG